MNKSGRTINDLSVSPRDFVADYHGAEKRYNRHIDFLEKTAQGMTPAEHAKSLGFTRGGDPSEYCTASTQLREWQNKKQYSCGIRGLIKLLDLGIFQAQEGYNYDHENKEDHFDPERLKPLDIDNHNFELLSLMTSLGYWTGGNQKSRKSPNSTAKAATMIHRNMSNDKATELIKNFIRELELKGWCSSLDSTKYSRGKRNGLINGEISRLLSFFNEAGNKTTRETAFPKVVELALETLEGTRDRRESSAERIAAYNILRDFVVTFMLVRGRYADSLGHVGSLVAHKEKDIASERGDKFQKILQMSDCSNLMPQSKLIPTKKDKNSWASIFLFRSMRPYHMERFRNEMEGRINDLLGNNDLA